MRAVLIVALTELHTGLRNRWVVMAIGLLASLALILALAGTAPTGTRDATLLAVTVVSLSNLSVYLLALLLGHDAVVGEVERGTLALTLTCPLGRAQFLAGKYLGHLAILVIALVLGYGAAVGLIVALTGETAGLDAFARLIGTSVLLSAAFLAVAYLVSVVAKESGTAAGMAVGLWLLLTLIWDLGLLGLLVAYGDVRPLQAAFPWLLLANPADSYRLANLTGLEGVEALSGMAGVVDGLALPPAVPFCVLLAWIAVPLLLATFRFQRFEP